MENSRLSAKIDQFAWVFNSYVGEIEAATLGAHEQTHRKILYFSVLEALAQTRYPKRGPQKACASFVVKYSNWKDGERVSLPHLVAALERTDDPRFEEPRNVAYRRLNKWGTGGPLRIDRDPGKTEVQKLWPKNSSGTSLEIPGLGFDWKALQHRRLLYAYRSKLSHESRQPTASSENPSDRFPIYEDLGEPEKPEWHLVYPVGFLADLCRTGIQNLKAWLVSEARNPYEQFLFGRFLIEKLNDSEVQVRHPFVLTWQC